MFLNKLFALANAPTEVEKMLIEQQETLRKLEEIKKGVQQIKNGSMTPSVGQMYDASNTLQNPILDVSKLPVIEKAEKFFDGMDKVVNYITHPILIFNAFAGASYWICLLVAIGGVMFFLIGHKKGLKYTTGSILSYTLIQVVNCGLNTI